MTKYLQWTFADGSAWWLAASIVARDRAIYYANRDPDTTFQEEYDYAMGDDYELRDWFANNMHASEFEQWVVKIRNARPVAWADGVDSEHTGCEVIESCEPIPAEPSPEPSPAAPSPSPKA